MNKLIGEVIDLPKGGHAVRLHRYPSGRRLPEPRLLLTDKGAPFGSRHQALDALNAYRSDQRSVKQLRALPVAKRKRKAAPVPLPPIRNAAFVEPEVSKRKRVRQAAPFVRPEIVKMPVPTQTGMRERAREQVLIDLYIANGAIKITRCEEFARPTFRGKQGGALPAHLDPVTLS